MVEFREVRGRGSARPGSGRGGSGRWWGAEPRYRMGSAERAALRPPAKDQKFLNLLDNISELQVSRSDYDYISSRFIHNVSAQENEAFSNALRLFATKEEVKQYNMEKLAALKDHTTGTSCPVLKIKAKHNCSQASKESTDSAEGCKIMLRANLWLREKLCNGTVGTVHDIIFAPQSETPYVILCEFPSYNGPSIIPGTKIVPIKPILKSWANAKGVQCARYQFPITLCYACSIHKSQGMTLDKAVINIGKQDFSLGLSYVAFSRVRELTDLLIEPFCFKRLQPSPAIIANLEMRGDFLQELTNKL
ncbi:ATP-dependent DNA helicase PIF7 [Frankliniella fusca]|uniref:ATP-dependent DNA helicase PIF7 n=1 Tax=Frankliniella fusca TaxID=407009 RepID=A0AAE1GX76_9NEOP|nr:ATP-dependent DNA helicase PIF7 [Frankliniella fusca]